jgi:protoporphyrinogen IX oxidase
VGDIYLWLKAVHVAAALIFGSGVIVTSLLLSILPAMPYQTQQIAAAFRRYDQHVTMPAMLVVWALGLALATTGSWFGSFWVNAKLGLVVLISGLHGYQSGRLRKIAAGAGGEIRTTFPLVIAVIIATACFAVLKP